MLNRCSVIKSRKLLYLPKQRNNRDFYSSSTNTNQQQKASYSAIKTFKIPKQPNKSSRPKHSQPYKLRPSPLHSVLERTNKRSSNSKPFLTPKQVLSFTKFWKPTLFTAYLTMSRYSSGRKIDTFYGTVGKINKQQMGPLYRSRWFQDIIQVNPPHPPLSSVSINLTESIFLPVTCRRHRWTSPETDSEKSTRFRNSRIFFPAISCSKKEWKVMSDNRPFYAKSIRKEANIQDGDSQPVSESILVNDRTVSIDLTDAYLHIPIQPRSRKYLRFMFTVLPFGMSLSPWIFTKPLDVIAAPASTPRHFHTYTIGL